MDIETLKQFIQTEAYNYESTTGIKPNTLLLYEQDWKNIIEEYKSLLGKILELNSSEIVDPQYCGMYVFTTINKSYKSKASVSFTMGL